MKTAKCLFSTLKCSKFCLLGIGISLIAIHLTLVWRTGDENTLSTSILFWAAVYSLLAKKRNKLNITSDLFSSLLGLAIIVITLIKSQHVSSFDFFLRLSPLLSALGLGLIASGIKGLKQYWQELLILCLLIPHSGLMSQVLDISKLTAQFASSLLWYLGFQVSRQGVHIVLPNGNVEVNPGCAGYSSILQLLGIAVISIIMFPMSLKQKILTPIVALTMAFIVNGIRVALMAVLASSFNKEAFIYWHNGDGSLIFSIITVLLFGTFCYFMLQPKQPINQ